ncbi:MAG: cyclic nucleotide-binding domain-containing protein, partial [Cyanobacteria bacterium P01_F01_bin.3]
QSLIRTIFRFEIQDTKGKHHTIDEMTRGDFFGYSAILANEPSPMAVTALEDLEVLIIEVAAVQNMLNKTPMLSQQLGMVIDARQSKLKAITLANNQSGSLLFSSR